MAVLVPGGYGWAVVTVAAETAGCRRLRLAKERIKSCCCKKGFCRGVRGGGLTTLVRDRSGDHTGSAEGSGASWASLAE